MNGRKISALFLTGLFVLLIGSVPTALMPLNANAHPADTLTAPVLNFSAVTATPKSILRITVYWDKLGMAGMDDCQMVGDIMVSNMETGEEEKREVIVPIGEARSVDFSNVDAKDGYEVWLNKIIVREFRGHIAPEGCIMGEEGGVWHFHPAVAGLTELLFVSELVDSQMLPQVSQVRRQAPGTIPVGVRLVANGGR